MIGNFFATLLSLFKAPAATASEKPKPSDVLRGDGTWPWTARIDGDDIVVTGARATCFGGANDPQDSGATASGISTKDNPNLIGCALPLAYKGKSKSLIKALRGSPIPSGIPWNTVVQVTAYGKTLNTRLIDLGPAKYTGNPIDLTIAAAQFFKPGASATNFALTCDFRIKGAAKYVKA